MDRKHFNKPIVAVSLALVLVLLLMIAAFVFGSPDFSRAEITLPDPQTELEDSTRENYLSENSLLQVTSENAATALRSLKKPEYYHQIFSVVVGEETKSASYQVELWVNGAIKRAEITSEQSTKIILADRQKAFIWYANDEKPVRVTLGDDIAFEDILGLPGFDYLQTIQNVSVTEAEYLIVEKAQAETPCIFLSLQETEGGVMRYWIDLTTGLLFQADCVEENAQVYRVEQNAFDRMANGDELFAEKFLLPDGTAAFTEGA